MKLKFGAAAAAVMFSVGVQAADIALDPTLSNQQASFSSMALPSSGAFTHTFTFAFNPTAMLSSVGVATGTQVSISGFSPDITFTSVSLNGAPGSTSNGSTLVASPLGVITINTSVLGAAAAGDPLNNPAFTLVVMGTGDTGGSYGGSLNVAVTNPVPEPGTYAMLLAGLAAVGFVAKRRAANV